MDPAKATRRRPVITTFEFGEPGADGHKITPNQRFTAEVGDRGNARVGAAGYAILRSQVLAAIPQLDVALKTQEDTLRHAATEATGLPEGPDRDTAIANVQKLGRMLHWEAITRLGVTAEHFVALVSAYEAHLDDPGADVAGAFLRHDLDLLRVFAERKRRRLSYWERFAATPSLEELRAAGLDADEARVLRSGFRATAQQMLALFRLSAEYYTAELHSVYTKYKHGYSLIDPGSSQLFLKVRDPSGRDLPRALGRGFAVMHKTHDGRVVLQIVKSDASDFRACVAEARRLLALTYMLAVSWLYQVEHAQGRSAAIDTATDPRDAALQSSAMRKWIGNGFDGVFDRDEMMGVLEGVQTDGHDQINASGEEENDPPPSGDARS